jgi:hypothetical protein
MLSCQGFPDLSLGAVVEVTFDLADFYFGVAGYIVILFNFTRGAFELTLFEAILVLLQSIVEYHLPPPSVNVFPGP